MMLGGRWIVMKTFVIILAILLVLASFRRYRHSLRYMNYGRKQFTGGTQYRNSMTSKDKGTVFEDFVADLLADPRLTLLDRTQDRTSSRGIYAESCKNPDLHIKQPYGNGYVEYYLECKYKSHRNSDGSVIFDSYKIARYRNFQRENRRKVLLAVGIGPLPYSPEEFLIVPLDSLNGNALPEDVSAFRVHPTPEHLISYINQYFNKVFSKH